MEVTWTWMRLSFLMLPMGKDARFLNPTRPCEGLRDVSGFSLKLAPVW